MTATPNVIEITFGDKDALWLTGALYQWDTGQVLHFNDSFADGTEVQFGRRYGGETVNRIIEGGYVQIPNELLQSPDNLIVWVVAIGEDHQTTVKRAQLDVKKRSKPSDYVAPEDKPTFRNWVQQQVNQAVAATSESASQAAKSEEQTKRYAHSAGVSASAAAQSQQAAGNSANAAAKSQAAAAEAEAGAKESKTAAAKSAAEAAEIAEEIKGQSEQIDKISSEVDGLKDDIVNKIDAPPENPTVGKILKIKSVNADGTFNCEWADDESNAVDDVQINGTSILADGVANIPLAAANTGGVISGFDNNFGIGDGEYVTGNSKYKGVPVINPSNNTNISNRTQGRQPIVPTTLDYAVKAAMCDGKGAAWTAEEQEAACERMNAVFDAKTSTTPLVDITLEEITSYLNIDLPNAISHIKIQVIVPPDTEQTFVYVDIEEQSVSDAMIVSSNDCCTWIGHVFGGQLFGYWGVAPTIYMSSAFRFLNPLVVFDSIQNIKLKTKIAGKEMLDGTNIKIWGA